MTTVALPTGFVEQRRGNTLWWLKVGWENRLLKLIPSHVQEPVQQAPTPSANSCSVYGGDKIIRPERSRESVEVEGQNASENYASSYTSTSIVGGRGLVQRIEIVPHEAIIIRPYRRGGFVRHFTRDLYWDRPLRPFAELCCTEEARRRRVPTVEVLGARVEWIMGMLYRGLLVTREANGFHTLWNWLQTEEPLDLRQRIVAVVAQAVTSMHNAGIVHADLNPTNILVYPDSHPPQALIIDFDRARLLASPVPPRLREANLRRFRRFFANYDPGKQWLSTAEFEHFHRTYEIARALKK